MKCEICGATENIQKHHIQYNPTITQYLCVDCHREKHGGHYTGVPSDSLHKMRIRDEKGRLKPESEIAFDIQEFMRTRGIKDKEKYLEYLRTQKMQKLAASEARASYAEGEIRVIDKMLEGAI